MKHIYYQYGQISMYYFFLVNKHVLLYILYKINIYYVSIVCKKARYQVTMIYVCSQRHRQERERETEQSDSTKSHTSVSHYMYCLYVCIRDMNMPTRARINLHLLHRAQPQLHNSHLLTPPTTTTIPQAPTPAIPYMHTYVHTYIYLHIETYKIPSYR